MNPFFNTPAQLTALQTEAKTWVGTPFVDNVAIKGAGACCQKLAGAIYITLGAVPRDFVVPSGPMDWGHAHKDSLISNFMEKQTLFQPVPNLHSAQPGDLLAFQIGGCVQHCGVIFTPDLQFIHCIRPRGVCISRALDATYITRLKKLWRPMTA